MLDHQSIKIKMLAASKKEGLPVANHQFVTFAEEEILLASISDPTSEYVWILRKYDTGLMPLYSGINPLYLDDQKQEAKYFYIHGEEVEAINFAKAKSLISKQPFSFKHMSMGQITESMHKLLSNTWMQTESFHTNQVTTDISSWPSWAEVFKENGNELMESFMTKAIKSANSRLLTLRAA
ncbi:hypothetical protein TUM3794_19840 [Shewanella colwelliana]|uniref:Uncharacterized protein n=1 Tax=Shewanella colwelliana TaxID=23 RepID=A0ABQ4P086_SHECO|nr:hypothetical protein [Shewanella colwelliana]GIU40877.1 hypothetical protein TUM3794_19840 [Shewanella colwelliana]